MFEMLALGKKTDFSSKELLMILAWILFEALRGQRILTHRVLIPNNNEEMMI